MTAVIVDIATHEFLDLCKARDDKAQHNTHDLRIMVMKVSFNISYPTRDLANGSLLFINASQHRI